ncbi:hypothetical protein [Duganella sp. CF458]|uniref:hypothetical protein n=1 Tax=Duganella sp. CF458 TaxID=1884368 RepID=UPI0011135924|nr:hypothetical protein [Duganella sp. CF458]
MKKRLWNALLEGDVSIDAIKTLHTPAMNFKLSPNSYEQGVRFPWVLSVPATVYILEGECTCRSVDAELIVRGSEILDAEPGRYEFEVTGGTKVKLVTVYSLPPRA